MARNDNREQFLLDQYWDADEANRRYIPAELDASLRETVDRFHRADDAPDPDPAFVDRLWSDIAGESSTASPATTTPAWTIDPDDEPAEPQFIPGREENDMQTRQQSIWRRHARQVGELVAGVLVLALITGGLILAYQNLIGEGEGELGPASEDTDGMVPSLTSVDEVQLGPEFFTAGVIEIEDQDYILTVGSARDDAEADGVELRVAVLNENADMEMIATLEAPTPWDTYLMQAGIGPLLTRDETLFVPLIENEQPGLWMVDLSDPEAPRELGYIETEQLGVSMAASDELLAIAGYFGSEVMLFDISEPDEITRLGSFELSAPERPVIEIDDDHLYIVYGSGLGVFDVSDPAEPREAARYENPDWPGPDQPDGIRPVTPQNVTEQMLSPGSYSDIYASDGFAYVSAGNEEIIVFDVSDPSEPVEHSHHQREDRTFRIAGSGDYLYVLGAEAVEDEEGNVRLMLSLEIIEIVDPKNMTLVDRVDDLAAIADSSGFELLIGHFAHGGDSLLAYGPMPGAILARIDWVEPADDDPADAAPTPETLDENMSGRVPSLSPFGVLGQQGDILQASELGSVRVARHEGQDYAFLLTFPMSGDGDEVYPTIQVLRLVRDGQPETVGALELESPWSGPMQFNMGQMALVDGVLYVPMPLEARPGVWTVDVSNPESPTELGFLDIEADWPMTIVAAGDVAVATGMFGNICFFLDISNPTEPVVASQLESSELELHAAVEVPALTMKGENLSISHPRGLTILDVNDPSNPGGLSAIENPYWEGPGGVEGAGTDTQIAISDEDSMLDRMVDPDAYHDAAVVGDHAYVAAGDAGVLVFDVSDPSDPQAVEPVELSNRTFRLTESNGFLYALGVSAEGDDEQQQPVWAWSIDVLELDDPDEPQIVSQLENLIPSDAGDDAASFFLMSSIRQAVSGHDFSFAWGRAGAYLAAIDWVEPGDDQGIEEE